MERPIPRQLRALLPPQVHRHPHGQTLPLRPSFPLRRGRLELLRDTEVGNGEEMDQIRTGRIRVPFQGLRDVYVRERRHGGSSTRGEGSNPPPPDAAQNPTGRPRPPDTLRPLEHPERRPASGPRLRQTGARGLPVPPLLPPRRTQPLPRPGMSPEVGRAVRHGGRVPEPFVGGGSDRRLDDEERRRSDRGGRAAARDGAEGSGADGSAVGRGAERPADSAPGDGSVEGGLR